MKHITAGAVSLVLLFGAVPAFAETNAGVTLAATGRYSAGARSIAAHAVLQSAQGDISDAAFGVTLTWQGGYDAVFIPARLSLSQNAQVTEDLTVPVPNEASGDLTAFAVVVSASGAVLASQTIWSGTVASIGSDPLTCKVSGASAACTVEKGKYTLEYHVYQGGPGGRERAFAIDTDAGGKTISIPKDALPAGTYSAIVRLMDGRQSTVYSSRRLDLMVPGTQGGIDTFVVRDSGRGYAVTATAHVSSSSTTTPAWLSFQALKAGVPCGIPLVATTTDVALTYKPTCAADSIVASLIAGGVRVDSAAVDIAPNTAGFATWSWPSAAMLFILIACGLTLYARRRRPMMAPPAPPPAMS